MSTKLIIFAAALIATGPVFAAGGAGSGGGASAGSSNVSTPSGGGGGSGGGSHGGGAGGGGGHVGGGGMGGRGAAASAHGVSFGAAATNHGLAQASSHAFASHAAKPTPGQHLALGHPPSKMAGTNHHHSRFHHREPRWGDTFPSCSRFQDPFLNDWNNCFGPTKSTPGTRSRS
jgi:hypothetical protein